MWRALSSICEYRIWQRIGYGKEKNMSVSREIIPCFTNLELMGEVFFVEAIFRIDETS